MLSEESPEDRLALIEARLSRIESKLALPKINKPTHIAEPSPDTAHSASHLIIPACHPLPA
jgi:hypothetical protein